MLLRARKKERSGGRGGKEKEKIFGHKGRERRKRGELEFKIFKASFVDVAFFGCFVVKIILLVGSLFCWRILFSSLSFEKKKLNMCGGENNLLFDFILFFFLFLLPKK